eukprot:CAMPEP_0181226078 /NCGR_PEP_ID=MMETSP1096-20121128/32061_1 /TAXON_ID=156174 ORGANISM="Chrysochromulina ericina, Strain CCMP281" /NCGR_SAMPLE_ID=MMETSP1096 /ASSEMBLY_ACC=CAM_ASM_000453 /LENGTH=85 /DNA_ID=CAMNT_0023319389 /DNA_START=535 /DNA_END=793 /DNA_ORIENTATION=-
MRWGWSIAQLDTEAGYESRIREWDTGVAMARVAHPGCTTQHSAAFRSSTGVEYVLGVEAETGGAFGSKGALMYWFHGCRDGPAGL